MKKSGIFFPLFLSTFFIFSFTFNPTITCEVNRILNNIRYQNLKAYIYRDQYFRKYYTLLESHEAFTNKYGRIATQNISKIAFAEGRMTLADCKHIILNRESCCYPESFTNFTSIVNSFYNEIFNNTQYPIYKYFNNLTISLGLNQCNFSKSINAKEDSKLAMIAQKYEMLLQNLQVKERVFINQTLCLVCLGTKDYSSFIYPFAMTSPQISILNKLIFNEQYFLQRLNEMTSFLLQLQSLHNDMVEYIHEIARTISGSGHCNLLKQQALSTALIESKKICTDEISCRKIAVLYFGLVATPQLFFYINRKSLNMPIPSPVDSYIISNHSGFGFAGNTTYKNNFGNQYLPSIQQYVSSNQYKGLY